MRSRFHVTRTTCFHDGQHHPGSSFYLSLSFMRFCMPFNLWVKSLLLVVENLLDERERGREQPAKVMLEQAMLKRSHNRMEMEY